MRRFSAIADQTEDGLVIRTDWDAMPGHQLGAAVDALCAHLGCHPEAMRKAGPLRERVDPRFGELAVLIAHATDNWAHWGKRLAERVVDLVEHVNLFPIGVETQRALRSLFDDHRAALQVSLGAPAIASQRLARLQDAHLLSPLLTEAGGGLEIAYRLGKGLDTLRLHELPVRVDPPPFAQAVALARTVPLTETDRHAIRWAQTRAGELIRRPVETAAGKMAVRLGDEEIGSIRHAVAGHIAAGEARQNLVHDLQEAVKGTAISNDLERIARTELAAAHNFGAYVKLKEQAKAAGIDDPQVYRTASINACEHCKRIWGPPTKPKIYRLSLIEAREAAGGNVGVPSEHWGPVIGPVHPNCLCGPVALWHPSFGDAVSRAAEEVIKKFGRF